MRERMQEIQQSIAMNRTIDESPFVLVNNERTIIFESNIYYKNLKLIKQKFSDEINQIPPIPCLLVLFK